MKIGMIGQKGIATGSGGIEKHVEEISKRLVKNGHDVTVYCRNTYMEENLTEYKGIKLKLIKTIKSKSLDAIIYTFRATVDALRENYDIYHYHAIGPASLCFIPILKNKKVIITVHGLDWQRAKWSKLAKLYLKFGEYITGKYATKIISVSNHLRNYFIKKYNRKEEDVIFIPNGVNIIKSEGVDLIKKYDLEKYNYILFLARLVPEKGVHYLIKAYNQISTDKKLVIAGGASFSDDYVNQLKELAEGNKNIIFTGDVQGKVKVELYSNCYIYVLPSDIEGMPLTLLEAMSYGTCCLVSDIPENAGVIKTNINGFTFTRGNVKDLIHMITLLNNNSVIIKEICEKAKNDINENYNWNNITYSLLETYKMLL